MKIFLSAKILLLINLILSTAYSSTSREVSKSKTVWALPQFSCGTYLVEGNFGQNSMGDFILTLRPQSSSPFELLILGGDFKDKLAHVGASTVVEVYVPKAIKEGKASFVFLQKFKDGANIKTKNPSSDIALVSKESCRLRKKFHQN